VALEKALELSRSSGEDCLDHIELFRVVSMACLVASPACSRRRNVVSHWRSIGCSRTRSAKKKERERQ
jgi:hypothetical protein